MFFYYRIHWLLIAIVSNVVNPGQKASSEGACKSLSFGTRPWRWCIVTHISNIPASWSVTIKLFWNTRRLANTFFRNITRARTMNIRWNVPLKTATTTPETPSKIARVEYKMDSNVKPGDVDGQVMMLGSNGNLLLLCLLNLILLYCLCIYICFFCTFELFLLLNITAIIIRIFSFFCFWEDYRWCFLWTVVVR